LSTKKATGRLTRRKTPRLAASSRAYELAARLEAEIIAGKRKPRERLIELELASAFGVSRAPVREALRMLEREGLVSNGLRGVQVAAITSEEVTDTFEILAHLEELYTTRAAPHVGADGVARMQRILEDMGHAVEVNDVHHYYDLNLQFHQVIRDVCPNRKLVHLLENLGKQTLRYRHLAMSLPGRLRVSLEEHRAILDALVQGDAATAGRQARLSADRAYRALADLLRQNPQLA
jgi:DNA-binding GntR family transcriptional regulator